MWWNNVETKPGTGYPTLWEDQEKYRGGWEKRANKLRLKLHGRWWGLLNIFFNPFMPTIDDYYDPWTYRYDDLFNAPHGDDQPTARPVSMITGKPLEIESGPNWDDDLGGSPIYAANDPNLKPLTEEERQQLFELEHTVFFYLPRICNHCLNPSCLAACPAGAIYKRGEDGIVLASQEKCRGWRMCISGCPYKKVYYNWSTGKAEKCILCYPRLETGQVPACFHSCVGRIRYVGVLLYDADRIEGGAKVSEEDLVEAQRDIILNPFDLEIIAKAQRNGIQDSMIEAAQKSPVYKFVKEYKLALPLHPELRTLPMLFYVPPLLPITASVGRGTYEVANDFFSSLESARFPIRYMTALFAAGNEIVVKEVYQKLTAVRIYKRAQGVGDISAADVKKAMDEGRTTPEEAEEISRLTSLSTFEQRFVIPPLAREMAIGSLTEPSIHKTIAGVGFRRGPKGRG
jgi:nitrate reductase beta subunit